jgi:hypothetical protein
MNKETQLDCRSRRRPLGEWLVIHSPHIVTDAVPALEAAYDTG